MDRIKAEMKRIPEFERIPETKSNAEFRAEYNAAVPFLNELARDYNSRIPKEEPRPASYSNSRVEDDYPGTPEGGCIRETSPGWYLVKREHGGELMADTVWMKWYPEQARAYLDSVRKEKPNEDDEP